MKPGPQEDRLLARLYDLADANCRRDIDFRQLAEALGMSLDAVTAAVRHLGRKKWAEATLPHSRDGCARITARGIDRVEALRSPWYTQLFESETAQYLGGGAIGLVIALVILLLLGWLTG